MSFADPDNDDRHNSTAFWLKLGVGGGVLATLAWLGGESLFENSAESDPIGPGRSELAEDSPRDRADLVRAEIESSRVKVESTVTEEAILEKEIVDTSNQRIFAPVYHQVIQVLDLETGLPVPDAKIELRDPLYKPKPGVISEWVVPFANVDATTNSDGIAELSIDREELEDYYKEWDDFLKRLPEHEKPTVPFNYGLIVSHPRYKTELAGLIDMVPSVTTSGITPTIVYLGPGLEFNLKVQTHDRLPIQGASVKILWINPEVRERESDEGVTNEQGMFVSNHTPDQIGTDRLPLDFEEIVVKVVHDDYQAETASFPDTDFDEVVVLNRGMSVQIYCYDMITGLPLSGTPEVSWLDVTGWQRRHEELNQGSLSVRGLRPKNQTINVGLRGYDLARFELLDSDFNLASSSATVNLGFYPERKTTVIFRDKETGAKIHPGYFLIFYNREPGEEGRGQVVSMRTDQKSGRNGITYTTLSGNLSQTGSVWLSNRRVHKDYETGFFLDQESDVSQPELQIFGPGLEGDRTITVWLQPKKK